MVKMNHNMTHLMTITMTKKNRMKMKFTRKWIRLRAMTGQTEPLLKGQKPGNLPNKLCCNQCFPAGQKWEAQPGRRS